MRPILTIILCCVMMQGCKEQEQPHLPRQKMIDIMTDIHVAEIYSTMVTDSAHRTTNKNMDSLALYYKSVFSHHKVSTEDFQNSMKWYSAHPKELDTVYIGIMAEISTLEGVVGTLPQ